nr:hypothetical protein [Tanacetum cinerariifolium]
MLMELALVDTTRFKDTRLLVIISLKEDAADGVNIGGRLDAASSWLVLPMEISAASLFVNVADAASNSKRDVGRSRNGDDSHDSGADGRRRMHVARGCTYTDFLKCQPMNFKDTKGIIDLTKWIKKMEFVFLISDCTVKGTDVLSYKQRFQELPLMYGRMFPEESDEVEKYVSGLPDMIHGSVMTSKPKTMHDAIEFATELMDQKIRTMVERQAENKRKFDENNQTQQQPPKKQNVAGPYSSRSNEKKEYVGTLPLCNKCKFHHNGSCIAKCTNCKRVGHLTQDCRNLAATSNQRNLTCYECGNQRHYRSDC